MKIRMRAGALIWSVYGMCKADKIPHMEGLKSGGPKCQWVARNCSLVTLFMLALLLHILSVAGSATAQTPPAAPAVTAFPLKVSSNKRYLVDSNGVPFLMVGDSPQALIGKVSLAGAELFMANRESYHINTLWVNLLCNDYTACNSDGSTFDRIDPFLKKGDLSTPNPAYFNRAARMLDIAAAHNMVVLLVPIETGGWLDILRSNGTAKAFAFGQYLGRRFRSRPNIIWMSGNDFQTWTNTADTALVQAVAKGIKSTDRRHLQTVELNYYVSASLDDPTWRSIIDIDAVYTYRPTYAKLLSEYRRTRFMPTFMVEANYEFEHNGGTDGGSIRNLRKQEYWTFLSGATGQLYASSHSWTFDATWQSRLDTTGIRQFDYAQQLFSSLKWYELVPDHQHQVVTSGYGTYSRNGSINTDTYATAAATADGKLAMVYMPTSRTVTVDMTKLSGLVTARWYDPTNGSYVAIAGSPFSNTGTRNFSPPASNSSGDHDWVLVLQAG